MEGIGNEQKLLILSFPPSSVIASDASAPFCSISNNPYDSKMPLEATMLVIDNSEYMRNGDYAPTRFDALSDAVNVTFQTKVDSNPENTVGIMTMAGKGCAPHFLVLWTRN